MSGPTQWLGLDIGGANIKVATARGWARSAPLALWREPDRLESCLVEVLDCAELAECDAVAITMTGELADTFATKRNGVEFIVAAADRALRQFPRIVRTVFYQLGGRWSDAPAAMENWRATAAANWDALARWAASLAPDQAGLMIDIGSTTTDLVPIRAGQVVARGATDTQRLARGELVYTGVVRSPLCAVLARARFGSASIPLAQELFATMLDVYLWTGQIAEDPSRTDAVDGRAWTRAAAAQRMARAICADADEVDPQWLAVLADQARRAQAEQVAAALGQVLDEQQLRPTIVLTCGQGEFLVSAILEAVGLARLEQRSVTERLGPGVSACAAAYAVAVLAGQGARRL